MADNGSTDGSQEIAREMGARLVRVEPKGYGNALMGGISEARGRFIIMGDADDSYDFADILPFWKNSGRAMIWLWGIVSAAASPPGPCPCSIATWETRCSPASGASSFAPR